MKLIEMLAVSRFKFLSIQAQDFIEDFLRFRGYLAIHGFLSIQAQDFIEEAMGDYIGGDYAGYS